jgi:hypothetical protein
MRWINYLGCFCLLFFACDTSSTVDPVFENYFVKYYGMDGNQSAVDLLVNDDGSMILLGTSVSPEGVNSAFIVKVDPKGDVLWQRQCGPSGVIAADIELIRNGAQQGNLIVALNTDVEATSRIILIRISQQGKGIDSLMVPLHKNGTRQEVRGVTSLPLTGGFAITGNTDGALTSDPLPITSSTDVDDIFAFRIDDQLTNLDTLITQGGEYRGSGVKVFEAGTSGQLRYLLFGYSDRTNGGFDYEYNFEVIQSNSNGQQRDIKFAGTETEEQICNSVIQTPLSLGEGYLMIGSSVNSSLGTSQIYLAKFDKSVTVKSLDQKLTLSDQLMGVAAANAEPIGYYILANQKTENSNTNIFLAKIKFDGSEIWKRTFGSDEGMDTGAAVSTTPDGRVVVLGTMELETQQKMALIIVNQQGKFSD